MNSNNPTQSTQKSSTIVTLTASAIEKVKNMMAKDGKADYGLRVGVIPGGCAGLSYDLRFQKSPYDNDTILEQDGIKIFINPESATFINGITIDYKDTLKESGFHYINPQAKSSCGCGTSFS